MHFRCYILLPTDEARTSLEARTAVAAYLDDEGFALGRRFAGRCDYFTIGGAWSGSLTLLRLQRRLREGFSRFWKRVDSMRTRQTAHSAFRSAFPNFRGPIPIARSRVGYLGLKDDAQILDRELYQVLKRGFTNDVNFSWDLKAPNVLSTEYVDDDEWPTRLSELEGKHWVVVIDYHG